MGDNGARVEFWGAKLREILFFSPNLKRKINL